MLKVLLLIVLYNSSTGELQGVWEVQGQLPAFETLDQCEEVIKNEVPGFEVPKGFSLSARCIEPSEGLKTGLTT